MSASEPDTSPEQEAVGEEEGAEETEPDATVEEWDGEGTYAAFGATSSRRRTRARAAAPQAQADNTYTPTTSLKPTPGCVVTNDNGSVKTGSVTQIDPDDQSEVKRFVEQVSEHEAEGSNPFSEVVKLTISGTSTTPAEGSLDLSYKNEDGKLAASRSFVAHNYDIPDSERSKNIDYYDLRKGNQTDQFQTVLRNVDATKTLKISYTVRMDQLEARYLKNADGSWKKGADGNWLPDAVIPNSWIVPLPITIGMIPPLTKTTQGVQMKVNGVNGYIARSRAVQGCTDGKTYWRIDWDPEYLDYVRDTQGDENIWMEFKFDAEVKTTYEQRSEPLELPGMTGSDTPVRIEWAEPAIGQLKTCFRSDRGDVKCRVFIRSQAYIKDFEVWDKAESMTIDPTSVMIETWHAWHYSGDYTYLTSNSLLSTLLSSNSSSRIKVTDANYGCSVDLVDGECPRFEKDEYVNGTYVHHGGLRKYDFSTLVPGTVHVGGEERPYDLWVKLNAAQSVTGDSGTNYYFAVSYNAKLDDGVYWDAAAHDGKGGYYKKNEQGEPEEVTVKNDAWYRTPHDDTDSVTFTADKDLTPYRGQPNTTKNASSTITDGTALWTVGVNESKSNYTPSFLPGYEVHDTPASLQDFIPWGFEVRPSNGDDGPKSPADKETCEKIGPQDGDDDTQWCRIDANGDGEYYEQYFGTLTWTARRHEQQGDGSYKDTDASFTYTFPEQIQATNQYNHRQYLRIVGTNCWRLKYKTTVPSVNMDCKLTNTAEVFYPGLKEATYVKQEKSIDLPGCAVAPGGKHIRMAKTNAWQYRIEHDGKDWDIDESGLPGAQGDTARMDVAFAQETEENGDRFVTKDGKSLIKVPWSITIDARSYDAANRQEMIDRYKKLHGPDAEPTEDELAQMLRAAKADISDFEMTEDWVNGDSDGNTFHMWYSKDTLDLTVSDLHGEGGTANRLVLCTKDNRGTTANPGECDYEVYANTDKGKITYPVKNIRWEELDADDGQYPAGWYKAKDDTSDTYALHDGRPRFRIKFTDHYLNKYPNTGKITITYNTLFDRTPDVYINYAKFRLNGTKYPDLKSYYVYKGDDGVAKAGKSMDVENDGKGWQDMNARQTPCTSGMMWGSDSGQACMATDWSVWVNGVKSVGNPVTNLSKTDEAHVLTNHWRNGLAGQYDLLDERYAKVALTDIPDPGWQLDPSSIKAMIVRPVYKCDADGCDIDENYAEVLDDDGAVMATDGHRFNTVRYQLNDKALKLITHDATFNVDDNGDPAEGNRFTLSLDMQALQQADRKDIESGGQGLCTKYGPDGESSPSSCFPEFKARRNEVMDGIEQGQDMSGKAIVSFSYTTMLDLDYAVNHYPDAATRKANKPNTHIYDYGRKGVKTSNQATIRLGEDTVSPAVEAKADIYAPEQSTGLIRKGNYINSGWGRLDTYGSVTVPEDGTMSYLLELNADYNTPQRANVYDGDGLDIEDTLDAHGTFDLDSVRVSEITRYRLNVTDDNIENQPHFSGLVVDKDTGKPVLDEQGSEQHINVYGIYHLPNTSSSQYARTEMNATLTKIEKNVREAEDGRQTLTIHIPSKVYLNVWVPYDTGRPGYAASHAYTVLVDMNENNEGRWWRTRIEYKAGIRNMLPGQTVEFSNTAKLPGHYAKDEVASTTVTNNVKRQAVSVAAAAGADQISLHKTDPINSAHVEGAEFTLQRIRTDAYFKYWGQSWIADGTDIAVSSDPNSNFRRAGVTMADAISNGSVEFEGDEIHVTTNANGDIDLTKAVITTGEDGKEVRRSLDLNGLYMVTETKAPRGHARNAEPMFLLYNGYQSSQLNNDYSRMLDIITAVDKAYASKNKPSLNLITPTVDGSVVFTVSDPLLTSFAWEKSDGLPDGSDKTARTIADGYKLFGGTSWHVEITSGISCSDNSDDFATGLVPCSFDIVDRNGDDDGEWDGKSYRKNGTTLQLRDQDPAAGKIRLPDLLRTDAVYTLAETKTKDGYNLDTQTYRFSLDVTTEQEVGDTTVNVTHVTWHGSDGAVSDKPADRPYTSSGDAPVYVIPNFPGVELPEAGGRGFLKSLLFAGVTLVAMAFALNLSNTRRKDALMLGQ